MSTYQLGQRVNIVGIAEKVRDRSIWRPIDNRHIYNEAVKAWPQIKAEPGRAEYGMLRTRLIESPAPAKNRGVVVGKRTIQQGVTEHSYSEDACFLPCETSQVWLVSYDLHRKPVMCFEHQISALPAEPSVTIPAPNIPHPGFHTQGHFMRTAARNITNDHPIGGYGVTSAVIKLLNDTAEALEVQK